MVKGLLDNGPLSGKAVLAALEVSNQHETAGRFLGICLGLCFNLRCGFLCFPEDTALFRFRFCFASASIAAAPCLASSSIFQ